MSAVITKQSFLAKRNLPIEPVDLPDGDRVYVRSMTAAERDSFEAGLVKGDGKSRKTDFTNFRAKLVTLTMTDEKGTRVFEDTDADEVGKMQASIIQPIFEKAQKLNGLSQADVDELTKN